MLEAASQEFRLLCEDLALAAETLKKLESTGEVENETRREEYTALVRDLEAEILRSINKIKNLSFIEFQNQTDNKY